MNTHNLLFVFLMVTLVGGLIGIYENAQVADENVSVHVQMSRVLEQEIPVDVNEVWFEYSLHLQSCGLSDGTRDKKAYLKDVPGGAGITGKLFRTKEATEWYAVPNGQDRRWVASTVAGKERVDGDAISARDFRELVRECVQAVRTENQAPRQWPLTAAENRSSWSEEGKK
jgi:hypothetical protein